uniref:HEAT repeat-containing protein 1 n=1 Tax=Cyclopterus lumpus TaxID=8103 RepID=A0A8C2XMH8_CYCLU
MTSLAHQLRRLALPQSDPNLLTRSEVASLLFDPKDAVSMDRSTFYALGCTGLEELMGIEPAFLEFQDTLFSRASLTLERSVQSKEVNEKLDAGISLFLARLSPYFLLKPAHKCLEWLVHRFHVQLYNADALLRCSLPFHDTNVFVRVLQLLHIRDAAARWGWLLGPQKAGVPLSRGALVAHCYSDLSFMDFICSLVTGSVQAYSGRSGSCSQLRVIFSFYASTIVSALGAVEKVSDAIISKLLPFVHKGLKSSLTDYKAATLMIVCQLAVKVTMEASLVDILAAHVAKSLLGEPVLAKEGLGCLVVLLQNQKEGSAGPRASVSLSSVPALASTLQAMAAAHDVAPLLRYLLPHLIHAAFTCRSGETQKDQLAVLEAVLKSVPLTNGLDRTNVDIKAALSSIRYCAALDGVLAGHVTADGEKRLYHQFLSLSVSSGKHQMLGDSDTSLLLSLKHPQPSVRVSALEHLVGVIASAQSLDKTFLKDAVMERLKDDVPEVVSAALKVLEVCVVWTGVCVVWTGVCVCVWCGQVCVFPVSPGDVWWNPEKLDTNTCCYLGLTCRLFSVIIRGAGEGPASGSFRDLMKLLIKVHLCEPPMLFRFLCVLWGYGSNHGDQLDVKVGAVLQTRALYVGGAVLSAQPSTMLEQLAAADSPVVPSLLCCLTSPVREVRRAALGTLSSLSGAGASPFRPITERLLKNSEEIIADPSYLSQALGVLQEESVKAKRLRSSLQQLLQSAGTPGCPSYSACSLLRALSHANGPMTKPFFSALGGEAVQQKLLSAMLDVLLESRSPLVTDTVRSVFKGMAVDGQLVANELAPPEKPKVSVTVQQSRRSRMSQRYFYLYSGGAVSWQRVTLILELLQHKKKLKRAQTLVPVLFALLARSLDPCPADHTNMEYTKQLLLGCLLNVCHRLSPAGGAVGPDLLDEDKFSVELVVQCIRASDVPQTHHHALLLLGAAAAIFPEKVLLNIMPIFTFMGANIMRLDDAYSFRVIDQTVQMVIPALIQLSDGTSSSHVVAVVTRILHVFADALPHVPDHRRLPILSQLVTTLGPARFLWVLMLLLFKLHATQTATSTSEKDAALERDVDFWVSLCCEFKVSEQLSSLISILLFLLKLPDDKHDGETPPPIGPQREEVEELIFSLEAHSSKELRHFQFLSVSFMAQLLGSAGFIGKVAAGERCPLCFRLLEEILRYIHAVARRAEDNADKPTAKFWRVLLNKAYEVLDKVNSLLPTDTFITVMRGLMGNELASVRRKAMELLNNKLQHRTQWEDRQVTVLLQLTGDLLSIVGKSSGEVMEREAEHAINRQTALYSLKLLCRSFGSAHQEAFVPVLQRAVDIAAAPEEEKNVTGSALLCIAEVVGALKALAIPHLPRLMPAVLNTLTDRKELLTNEIYLLSAVTALQRVTETLPHFISPYLQDTTSQVCRLTRLLESSSSSSSAATQLSTRLASLRSTLATRLPPRVLLPTVTRCYGSMVVDRKRQLGALMSILKEHITHMEKDQLSFHQSELTSFFLCALDFRAEHCQGDLQKTSEVEGHVIDCLLSMVMKLSEVTFRPLFFKLLDWSKLGRERLLTFCRLSDVFADRLKGLFVLFAGNLVTGFVDLLRQTNGSKTDESLFDSKVKTNQLLRFVLDCLFKIFMFDTQKFVSRERGDALMSPLVDQLENTVGGDQVYQQLVTQHLVPCVGQFSVALADESQWKTLNYQILLKTRHPDSKVRFSSLLMLMELASKLKENYMVLLPETIPFLAELMEDDCEEVEQQVQKVVQEMEKILGEPLQSYF